MNSCARSKVWIPGFPGIRWDADSLRGNDVRGSARQNEDAPSVVESRRRRCAHVTLPSASQQRYYPRHRRSKTFPPELIKEFQAGYRGEPSRIRLMFVNRCAEWTSPRDRFARDCAHRHPVAWVLALRDRSGAHRRFLVVCGAISAVVGEAPEKRGTTEARWQPVCRRSSRELGFVVRGGRSRDTRSRKADGGSDRRPAECCRPGESARGMDPSYIPRISRIKFLIVACGRPSWGTPAPLAG